MCVHLGVCEDSLNTQVRLLPKEEHRDERKGTHHSFIQLMGIIK
jgi:hypothetical protein